MSQIPPTSIPELTEEDLLSLDFGPAGLSGLGLRTVPSARGRKGSPVAPPQFLRDLLPEDIQLLAEPPAEGSLAPVPAIRRMRQSHHLVARLFAEGRKAVEISQITGKSQSWLSTLQRDPAFEELIAYYGGQVEKVYTNVHERLATVGLTALEEIQERLDDDEASAEMSLLELQRIVEMAFDRSVAPGLSKPGAVGQSSAGAGVSLSVTFVQSTPSEGDSPVGISTVPATPRTLLDGPEASPSFKVDFVSARAEAEDPAP